MKMNFPPLCRAAAKSFLCLPVLALFIAGEPLAAQTNLVVAQDGSGQFKTVQEAIMAVPSGSRENPVVIHIKPGIYRELIYVQREKCFFKLAGENPTNTILTFNLYAGITNAEGKPIGTFKTPSTTIDADDFTAENLTFENSAGPVGQALAIRVDGDRASFRNCRFLGWQDTILLNRGRDYFEKCYIAGQTDFIFGAATAWFEKCEIHALRDGYLTAASTPVDQPFGFVFSNCKITGEPGAKTYLGRPWRIYAGTIYLNCKMSEVVRPEGWNDWKKPETHQTARYAEFNSAGAGASPTNRPDWTKQLTAAEARQITAEKVLGGADDWDPTLSYDLQFGPNRKDVEYGKAGGEKLLLDAHVPAGDGTFPIAIIVHGGGWMNGDKRHDISELFEPLDRANFTWFSIDYRLAPENRWPACFDDVQTAIRWVKRHATEFKGDPKRIALIGYSAGGHLATLAGTDADADARVQAVVGLAPPADLVVDNERRGGLTISMQSLFGFATTNIDDTVRAVLKQNSPITYIKPGLPPFLLVQGSADKTVPHPQTLDFAAKLRAAGVSCDLLTITNAQHAILDWDKFDPAWQAGVVAWLKQHLAPGGANARSNVTLPATADAAAPSAWSQVPAILSRIVPPTFPSGELVVTNYGLRADRRGTMGTFFRSHEFVITNYGAIGDGTTDCTRAFADAIAACNRAGGGRVVVPAGKFLTGPIHLLSNVNLHVVKEATILFTTNTAAYLPVVFTRYESTEVMNYSPLIYALGQKNIAITGEGTLDSQATLGVWHSWKSGSDSSKLVAMGNNDAPVTNRVFGAGHFLRPYFIQPTRCRNVLIEGVKILGSPMWVISPLYCTNVTVRGVTVEATGPNTDGCDPDSCTDVLIKDCSFSDGDDCIAIKSGRDRDGHRVNIPSRNLVIQNCHFKAGHGGVSAGSETAGGIENVFAEDCTFDSPDLDYAFRFKTNPARGGYVRNIFIRNCQVQTAKFGIHMTLRYSSAGALEGAYTPEMGNIDIRDCTFARLTKQPIFIEGYNEKIKITGVTIAHCAFQSAGDRNTITNASNIHLLDNRWGVATPP